MSSALWMQTQGTETRAVTSTAYLELSYAFMWEYPTKSLDMSYLSKL